MHEEQFSNRRSLIVCLVLGLHRLGTKGGTKTTVLKWKMIIGIPKHRNNTRKNIHPIVKNILRSCSNLEIPAERQYFDYLLIWNAFGKASKQPVLHVKLENIWAARGDAKMIYLNIFYSKHLWESLKTAGFARTTWRIWAVRGGQE